MIALSLELLRLRGSAMLPFELLRHFKYLSEMLNELSYDVSHAAITYPSIV